jgi:hypothetical protein
MRKPLLPGVCPSCGGSKLVRILWGYNKLNPEEEQAIGQGRALLGLNYRYLKAVAQGDPAPLLLLERSRLPTWGCLDCKPQWIDLHQLTLRQWEANAAKVDAVDASDFERAALLRDSQIGIETEQGADLLRLLQELI